MGIGKCFSVKKICLTLSTLDEFESQKERSKLSKSLPEVLSDKAALGYFSQFMESRSASSYILCWLDIDSFKSDILLKETPVNFSPVPKCDHDSLSVSTDCDSLTADTNSLCDFSLSVTQSSLEVCCDRDLSDTSPKLKQSVSSEIKSSTHHMTDNALVIFKKYIAQEAVSNIKCPDHIRNEIIENVCDPHKILNGDCFDKIQKILFEIMEKDYFEAFLGSDFFCKYQIDVLTSGNVALDDILHNETALFYFMEFLEQENARNLLDFWIAASNLEQQLNDQKEFFDPIEAQNDAVVLYDKYFSLQATTPLGFSDKIRFDIEQNICGENGLVLGCFYAPLKIIEQVLERNYLKHFLGSQLFYKYLSELINTVQANGYAMNIENSKTSPSDCGSERSFSTNSTFLALEINHNNNFKKKSNDMSIDTRHLCDPDSLWRRKKNHFLSCGRVTALGKFETDLEPEPDRKEFRLKNVMRKLVSLEEENRKKEEMAWQVAEMIVKDITSVTLNDRNKPFHS